MAETLLSPSNILLYGRAMADLIIDFHEPPRSPIDDVHPPDPETCQRFPDPQPPPRLGENNFLLNQLMTKAGQDAQTTPRLARIYGFSFEGHYYDLPKPAIFLVHGPGSDPEAWRPSNALPHARVDRAPADADRTGVAGTPSSFSEDMRVWSYDKSDHSLRLDTDSGTFEQILLERCLGCGPGGYAGWASGSGAFGSGAFGSGAFGSGAFGSGAFGSGAFGSGAYGSGAFGSGAYGRGRRGGGSD
jgi:hypothetical protein